MIELAVVIDDSFGVLCVFVGWVVIVGQVIFLGVEVELDVNISGMDSIEFEV